MKRLRVLVTEMAAHCSAQTNWPTFSLSRNYITPERVPWPHTFCWKRSPTSNPHPALKPPGALRRVQNILTLNNANAHMLTQQWGSGVEMWIQNVRCNCQVLPMPPIIPGQITPSASTCNFISGFLATFCFSQQKRERFLPCGTSRGSCSYHMSWDYFSSQFHDPILSVDSGITFFSCTCCGVLRTIAGKAH